MSTTNFFTSICIYYIEGTERIKERGVQNATTLKKVAILALYWFMHGPVYSHEKVIPVTIPCIAVAGIFG
jgi:hypothetical protein